MKTALITGVSGQDGAYLAKFLLEKGYRVVGTVRSYRCADTNNFDYLGITNQIIIDELDLLDIVNILQILQKYNPDELYNLAAQSSVGLSFNQPIGTFTFNTASVNNLLETIRLFNPDLKFYQASSSEMFGHVERLPITCNTPMSPSSPYAISKLASYHMTLIYRNAYNLFVCNGILFNHESVLRSNNFFIKKIIKESLNIKYGIQKKLMVGNLNIKRDFGYAPKYVEAMWLMMQQDVPDDFIICSGKSILLKDIVDYIFDKLGLNKDLIVVDKTLFRPNEVNDIYGDNSKAQKILNWNYDYSFFEIIDFIIKEEEKNYG